LKTCFQFLRLKQGFKQNLATQMMTPIQRVTRYQLLMREIEKSFDKLAQISAQLVEKAKMDAERLMSEEKEEEAASEEDEAEGEGKLGFTQILLNSKLSIFVSLYSKRPFNRCRRLRE
jgi:hypothetical protein